MNNPQPSPPQAITSRFLDFWLLGGASVVIWAVMMLAEGLRARNSTVESHFLQIAATFSLLGLICNHPHFMLSYRLGYGRGAKFIQQHWFCLLLVPTSLVAVFALAFFQFQTSVDSQSSVLSINRGLASTGTTLRLGGLGNLGTELLSLTVWLMYLTVGWHYSKQAFGCMMAYARFDQYPILPWQRGFLKSSLFSIAFFNFIYLNLYWQEAGTGQTNFLNIPVMTLGLPFSLLYLGAAAVAVSFLGVVFGIFWRGWRKTGALPSWNFLIPWIAFHVWWVPIVPQKEYYFMMVPFFHSLQNLPFAFRMEAPKLKKARHFQANLSGRILLLLLIGFLVFEWVPAKLDTMLDTSFHQSAWFFTAAFLIFINIHHFFIDSVVWRFHQPEVKKGLF